MQECSAGVHRRGCSTKTSRNAGGSRSGTRHADQNITEAMSAGARRRICCFFTFLLMTERLCIFLFYSSKAATNELLGPDRSIATTNPRVGPISLCC